MANNRTIHRGTTPHITCMLVGDLRGFVCLFSIGAKSNNSWFTTYENEMTIEYDALKNLSKVEFTLTQKQTLACVEGKAKAQFRAIDEKGNAMVSNTIDVVIGGIIRDGVIRYER